MLSSQWHGTLSVNFKTDMIESARSVLERSRNEPVFSWLDISLADRIVLTPAAQQLYVTGHTFRSVM